MARSKRLSFLASLTQGHQTVLDLGTDHGLVLRYAFEDGLIEKAIASDLREKPLLQARRNLKNYPVSFVISDGFLAIKDPFDLAIVAGMGAHLICDLMRHAPKEEVTYILQANDKPEMLRRFLMDHGFQIIDEYMVHDRFFYVVMKVIRGSMHLKDDEIFVGPFLRHKQAAQPYYHKRIVQIDKILPNVDAKRQMELVQMRQYYQDVLL